MRCPSCREVESQVCVLHAMGDRDAVDVEIERLQSEVSRLEERCATYREEREASRDDYERAVAREGQWLERVEGLQAEVSRLIRERDEARQARRMAEEEVEQLRARIRGDAPAAVAPPPTPR